MKRRALLATLGTASVGGLVGCIGSIEAPTGGDYTRRISLESQDTVPAEYKVDLDIELLATRVTPTQTARLRITTTNEGAKRAISIGGDGCELFNRSKGGSDDPPGLWLHDPDQTKYIDRKDDRWVADRPANESRAYPAYGCMRKTYEVGESRSNEYMLWDDYQVEGYMTPGTYRWEERVTVAETTDDFPDDDQLRSFPWGFTLRVKQPDS
jgi:hypothetical protein